MPFVSLAQHDDDGDIDHSALKNGSYMCYVDLTRLNKDKLTVTMTVPKQAENYVEFRMPAIVPGTYAIYNFGRFVSNLKAFDTKGVALQVEKTDVNGWGISNAINLRTITYEVEDTWDTEIKENYIFEPAGTNIDSLQQYVVNPFGFFGYLKNSKDVPYQLYITKPEGFYASTGAQNLTSGAKYDVLKYTNYNDLADSPIMYCKPDTTWLNIGGSQILISVYSPTQKANAKDIGKSIQRILEAQKNYLGGTLPVKKYAFIINLYKGFFSRSGAYGALEHSYSSFYFLPEITSAELSQTVSDIAAHEFFHIVTPLNIHSEEIQYFDFDNPKMSAHLWLYEGLTEYSASLVQVQNGLMEQPDFFDVLRDKIRETANYNDTVPFTTMSKGCLTTYADQYQNVYYKGALIGLCLDIKLRSLSAGKYGIQNLMVDLAKKYGKDKPFKDDELFDEITRLTYPEIGVFLKNYVGGNKPLPLAEIFDLAGIYYQPKAPINLVLLDGYIAYINNADGKMYIDNSINADGYGTTLQPGVEIKAINGKTVDPATALSNLILFTTANPGEKVKITAPRYLVDGIVQDRIVEVVPKVIPSNGVSPLIIKSNLSSPQQIVFKTWLNR